MLWARWLTVEPREGWRSGGGGIRAKGQIRWRGQWPEAEPGNPPARSRMTHGMSQVNPRCSEEVMDEQWGRQEVTKTGLELEVVVDGRKGREGGISISVSQSSTHSLQ